MNKDLGVLLVEVAVEYAAERLRQKVTPDGRTVERKPRLTAVLGILTAHIFYIGRTEKYLIVPTDSCAPFQRGRITFLARDGKDFERLSALGLASLPQASIGLAPQPDGKAAQAA